MNIDLEKKQIIEQILNVQEEWVLKAIRKLLDLDHIDDIHECHKQILNDRLQSYESNPSQIKDWEKFKEELRKK
jgi:hypothetical protein